MNARQWSRIAWTLALLFGTLPLAGRLVFGTWEFISAGEVACLLLLVGGYFHFRGRRYATKADPATLLDQAGRLAAAGEPERALALLTRTIRQNPRLWQAYQYRGELRLRMGQASLAAEDFAAAIRLAPDEPHLRALLERATESF